MTTAISRSFAGGEIGPELVGRADQAKYQTGLKTCINAIVQRYGGITNRPGSKFIAETKYGDLYDSRLVKFVFNADQTYVLEFGHQYMRVYQNGGAVVPTAAAWGIGTLYLVGDMALSGGIVYYCILDNIGNIPPNGTYWAAMTAGFYEIPTPYAGSDVAAIQYVQSADVITLVHPSYAPRDLSRTGNTAWLLTVKSFQPGVDRPTSSSAVAGAAGANSYRYRVTAYDVDTLEESYPARETTRTITGASQANPCSITANAHGYTTGDEVYITGIVGMTQLNDRTFIITKTGANTFTLNGVDSTAYTAYSSGGTVARTYARVDAAAAPTKSAPIVITFPSKGDGFNYWIYRENAGTYEFIGEANGNPTTANITFEDPNNAGDASLTPPRELPLFNSTDNYPSAVTYVQQRLALANTNLQTERIWLSQIGNFSNFAASSPIQSDDSINFQLAGRQVNSVRHLLEISGSMFVLTASGEWNIQGDQDGVVRPTAINPRQQGYNGSSTLSPVIIESSAIYVQAHGSIVKDLLFDINTNGFKGRDLTIFAPHLFAGYTLLAWDFQLIPHSVVWAARDDGEMLGLTYLREHEIWGWHHHQTDGEYRDVCVVPENGEDALYSIVRRTIGGVATRYVERFANREFTDIAVDAFFVDSGLTYDGRNTGSTTMTFTGGTLWDETETLTCTASGAVFAASNVGDEVRAIADDGEEYTFTISAYTSPTVVSVIPEQAIPADIQGVATTDWSLAVDTVTGLDHLEGKTVTALVEGSVNADMVVTAGSVTLTAPAKIAHVGLKYTSTIETLDPDNLNGETIFDKKRKVHEVGLLVKDTRGLFIGYGTGTMFENPQTPTNYNKSIEPFSGLVSRGVDGSWEKTGKIIVEQRDPLPFTILSIMPRYQVGG